MKIVVFHAGDGDCLLVSSKDKRPRKLLVDGGRAESYAANTRAYLGALRAPKDKIDVVCVSHIDDDHISGIVRLVEDEVAWRAYEFHQTLEPATKPPPFARPPVLGEVWHNGLYRLVGDDNAPEVEIVLANVATVLAGSPDVRVRDRAAQLADLASGEKSSMELSRRLSVEQLDIPLNPRSAGALLKRGAAGDRVKLGKLAISLLGPTQAHIDELRVVWATWLEDNKNALKKLQAAMLEEEESLGSLSAEIVANPMLDQALGDGLSGVTEANVASLMLLVEEGNATVLLTGDGVSSEILEGLEHHGKLDAKGRIHVAVLKVQHHGAVANVTTDFVQRVTADHYVFCGNGAHKNPEIEVVDNFVKARLSGIAGKPAVGPSTPFTLWFSSASTTPKLTAARKAHMKKVEKAVAKHVKADPRVSAHFLQQGNFEIAL